MLDTLHCCYKCKLNMVVSKRSCTDIRSTDWTAFFLLLIVAVNPALSGYTWSAVNQEFKKVELPEKGFPAFDSTTSVVSVYIGQVAFLPCRVKNIGDKVVSWIRTRDLHILTSGIATFTADNRFESTHTPGSPRWDLRLRNSQQSDAGQYECQVNTDPKINFNVTLNVKDATLKDSPYNNIEAHLTEDALMDEMRRDMNTKILGAEEQFVQVGSTVTFTCLVVTGDMPSVQWLKNGRQVSFQAARGGISVDTERTEKRTVSRLTVADVQVADSGNYTCSPSKYKPHSITLFVIEGELTPAMQRDQSFSTASQPSSTTHLPIIFIFMFTIFI